MKPMVVRSVRIGEGMPKICVPLTGETTAELKEEARSLLILPADIVEWRIDYLTEAFEESKRPLDIDAAMEHISAAAGLLRDILGDMPLLFTLRTSKEGGQADLASSEYDELIVRIAALGIADLIDLELFTKGDGFPGTVKKLHSMRTAVVGSNHDFTATPPKEELLSRLSRMMEGGADVCKIAVMPQRQEDVLTLLSASLSMREEHPGTPLIALSMGDKGFISRIAGEYFGSDITFAAADKASAPGQIGVPECRQMLELIHKKAG